MTTHHDAAGDADALDLVGYVLGEGDVRARSAVQARIARELDVALEVAETRTLFEEMRVLRVTPTGDVARTMAREIEWRSRLRGVVVTQGRRIGVMLRVAAVAAIWLWIGERAFLPDAVETPAPIAQAEAFATAPRAPEVARTPHHERADFGISVEVPVAASAEFVAAWDRVTSQPLPHDFANWLSAENQLARLRAAAQRRASPELRARWRQRTGAADVEDRVAALAREVESRTRALLASPDPEVEDVAFALRALLAAGIDGPRLALVDACRTELAVQVDALDAGRAAVALAALAELAVLETETLGPFVAARVDVLARQAIEAPIDGRRPPLLRWTESASRLAEAGRVLALAPAFGADAPLALHARMAILAHLEERLARTREFEVPELHALLAYGFGDLVDLPVHDARLELWPARLMLPDFLALVHYTWGSYPMRRGWAELQLELRGLAGVATPASLRDAASLLLALCSDAAASDARTPRRRSLSG